MCQFDYKKENKYENVYEIENTMKSKYKITKKKGRKLLIINSEKGQTLNKREVEEIQNYTMYGVLPIEVEVKKKGFVLTYDLTNYIPLEQYIQTIVNKKKFAEIMLQILEIFQKLAEQYYNTQNLIMELDKVMVNPSVDKIYFPFVPILYYDSGVTVKDFLVRLIYSTTFDSTENTDYADHCLTILQKNMNFSRVELEEYLKSQISDESRKKKIEVIKEVQEIYNPYTDLDWKKEKSKHADLEEKSERMTGSLTDVGSYGTVVLGEAEPSYLKREKTKEQFLLKQKETTVGKKQCAIIISDNPAVSRVHAKIIRMKNQYYLLDLKATNGTKVNGEKIAAGERILLEDEDVIEFANEKFIFYK